MLFPEVRSLFCEREGALLLALSSPGLFGSLEHQQQWELQVRLSSRSYHRATDANLIQAKTKVGFGLFSELYNNDNQNIAPAENTEQYVYVAGDQIINYQEQCVYMYPNTGAHIRKWEITSPEDEIGNPRVASIPGV